MHSLQRVARNRRLKRKLSLIKKQKKSFRKDLLKIIKLLAFIFIVFLFTLYFINCSGGWSVMGWEVK